MKWSIKVEELSELDQAQIDDLMEGHRIIPGSTLHGCFFGLMNAMNEVGHIPDDTVEKMVALNLYAWVKYKAERDKTKPTA